jgi:hypothetical protein
LGFCIGEVLLATLEASSGCLASGCPVFGSVTTTCGAAWVRLVTCNTINNTAPFANVPTNFFMLTTYHHPDFANYVLQTTVKPNINSLI